MSNRPPDQKTYPLAVAWDGVTLPAQCQASGAAAPSVQDLIAPVRIRTVNPETEDGLDVAFVLPHNLETDVATITLHPHVQHTCISTPAADATIVWRMIYTVAKPALALADAVTFPAVSTLVANTLTLTGAEYRKHLMTPLPAINLAAANLGPDAALLGTVQIASLSSVASSIVGLVAVTLHYQKGPSGTAAEY